jgi:hypothetical protein
MAFDLANHMPTKQPDGQQGDGQIYAGYEITDSFFPL